MANVTPATVADRLALPEPADDSPKAKQWQIWINQAYRQIARYQALYALDDPDSDDVDEAVLEEVAGLVRHPDDATTVDISVDDGRVSKTYRSGNGRIDMSGWWSTLWPSLTSSSEAFTIRPYYEPCLPC